MVSNSQHTEYPPSLPIGWHLVQSSFDPQPSNEIFHFKHLPESCFPQNPKKETHRQLCYQLLWANVFLNSYAIHGDGCCLVCVLNCQCKRLFLPGWSLINWSLNPIECQQRKLKNGRDCYWLAAPAALQSREEMLSRSMVLSMNKSAVFYKSFTSRMSVIHPAPPLEK
jgi:hypothetical protein